MALSYFCPHCGAEHVPAETLCHACQHPLDEPDTKTSPLLNERYEVLAEVGAGGFGAVYKARDTHKNNRFVAIKQINLKGLSSQEIIEATDAFNREAQILSTLSHPLLPRIFARFSDPDHWYLVMNFIEGQTLDDYLREYAIKALPTRTGLPLAEALAIGLQLCDVLHYLHSQQPPVIFRDLKPGNIMRTESGHLYLIDFGIARRFKPGQAKDTIPFGSPGFAAPEQYGRAQTTPQADIYSLGALLYCLLSDDDPSEHPFQFPPLPPQNTEGLRELEALIQRMVALDPAQRPADIQEIQNELQNIKHIHVGGQNAIWLPPASQPPASPGSAQQQIFFPPSPAHKTTRRVVVTGSLAIGGAILLGGALATTALLRANHAATALAPAIPTNGPTYWSPDLCRAAVVNINRSQIDLYNARKKQLLGTIKPSIDPSIETFSDSNIQWSPDNSKILFIPGASAPSIWDIKTRQQLFTLPFVTSSPTYPTMVWSPNGEYLAVSYGTDDNTDTTPTQCVLLHARNGQRVWQKSVSNEVFTYSTFGNPIDILAWSPDSNYLLLPDITFAEVSANGSWSATIWQSSSAQRVSTLTISVPWSLGQTLVSDTSLYISWSPSGKTIALYYSKRIWICSNTEAKATYSLASMNYDTLNYGPIWSPDGNFLAMLLDERLAILNVTSGQATWYKPAPAYLAACAWSADSKSITTVDGNNKVSNWLIR
ncbi:MAG TPA: protein kinase [Ktedonobacteraceae bacterium]